MKIQITVKPNSRRPGVEKRPDGSLRVSVNAPPIEGRANDAVVEQLSEYLKVPKSRISVISGHKSKRKCIEVLD